MSNTREGVRNHRNDPNNPSTGPSLSPLSEPWRAILPQPRPRHQATLLTAVRPNQRKQHTLDSIGSEKSGCRSPILDPADSGNLLFVRENEMPQSHMESSELNNLKPATLISPASFERRRSVFEGEDPANKSNRSIEGAWLAKGNESETSDQLSLEQILADIQAGKLPHMSISSEKNMDSQPRVGSTTEDNLKEQKQSTEMRELASPSAANLLTSVPAPAGDEYTAAYGPLKKCNEGDCNDRKPNSKSEIERKEHEMKFGFEVAWLDFTYSVEPNIFEDPRWGRINSWFHKERRMILKGLSGGFKGGQMVALMGPSGAGKTCLLESLSGVRLTGLGGQICLRGRRKAQLVIVPQYDVFLPQFSVEEIVTYGSRMKNPAGTNHAKVADEVIQQLGLQACRSNNIQSCSGGQRKRVAIAQELVSRPNILILDEPTSGLDSSCCYHTMKVLRDVLDQSVSTEQPMAIVSTIHQPSAKVFKMFDLVYLLGKTGLTAYSGPPGELLPTVREVTGLECPQYSNPSDFMIELVAYDYGEEPVEKLIEFEQLKAKQFVRDYERRAGGRKGSRSDGSLGLAIKSEVSKPKLVKTDLNCNGGSLALPTKLSPSKSDTQLALKETGLANNHVSLASHLQWTAMDHVDYKSSVSVPLRKATGTDGSKHPFLWHTWVHLHRSFLQSVRDPILNNMRILIHLGFATLLVLLYGKKSGDARGCPPVLGLPTEITDPNHESMIDLADNVGYLFMCIMMITYVSLMSTVLTFPIDIKTVGKEYKNGWYGTFTYFIGKTVADLPFIIGYPVVYCIITWYMTNQAQDHTWRYLSFTGLITMNAMNSQSFGLILGALFVNSVTAATFLGPVITIPWYLFTGFTKRIHRLAEPYKTISKFLFTRHVFEGLLDTVYGHQRCNCSKFLQSYHDLRYEEAVRLGELISMETLSSLDYYDGLEAVADVYNKTLFPDSQVGSQWFEKTVDAASTVFADGDLNLASLMETNGKASSLFSFGLDFEPTCPANYKNFVVQDFRLEDSTTEHSFYITITMLAVMRVLTFLVVSWKIRTRQF